MGPFSITERQRAIFVVLTVAVSTALLLALQAAVVRSFVVGAAIAMIAVALFARVPGLEAPTHESECSFCRAPRANVKFLVAGPTVSICENCCALSHAIFSTELDRKGESVDWRVLLAQSLPDHCRHEHSGRILDALSFGSLAPVDVRSFVREALRLDDGETMLRLLERIPESERVENDRLGIGYAYSLCGRYDEALRATDAVVGSSTPGIRALAFNNRIAMRLLASRTHPPSEMEAWLRELEQAKVLVTGEQHSLAYCLATEADVRLLLGDREGAARAIEAAAKNAAPNPAHLVTRARIRTAQGRREDARADLAEALRVAHPESRIAADARALQQELGS